jgi:hypothetical protein
MSIGFVYQALAALRLTYRARRSTNYCNWERYAKLPSLKSLMR